MMVRFRDHVLTRSRSLVLTVVINGLFALTAIGFGLIDSFEIVRDVLDLIPIVNVVILVHSMVRSFAPHWWLRLSVFGMLVLLVGVLWLLGTILVWFQRKVGGILVLISFIIAFAINLYVGLHPFVHFLAGVIAGVMVIPPLMIVWKELD